jgi:excisionase family DNA binding protein
MRLARTHEAHMVSLQKHFNVDNPLLSPREAAQLLGLSTQTLAVWRHRGDTRLAYVRVSGRAIRYRTSDIQEFILKNRRGSAGVPTGTTVDAGMP